MSPAMSNKDLKTLKRSELQKLAKQHGVRANMKNDDIISALQEIFDAENKNKQKSVERSPSKSANSSLDSAIDLMSMKPPWEDSDLGISSLDSTPDQGSINESFPEKTTVTPGQKRTRSSSRNRTPKESTAQSKKVTATKTFSVEKNKTVARTGNSKSSEQKQKALKRHSSNSDDMIKSKKMKRSSSSSKENDSKNESIDADLQKEIMDEIRKKIEATDGKNSVRSNADDRFSSKIPRFTASGVTIGNNKPITPGNKNWNKIHNKRFEKLESIDDYERRKKERAERLLGSNQKSFGTLSRLAQPVKRTGAKVVKPVIRKGRPKPVFMSPAAGRTPKTPRSIMKDTKADKKNTQTKTPKAHNTSVFKPTVTSTTKMNLNFAQKSAKAATPKRVTIVSDQRDKKQTYVKTPAVASRTKSFTPGEKPKSAALTPSALRTTTNVLTPNSTKKNMFDIKESLKKPLTWVPHKGPLRPFKDSGKKPAFKDRIKDIKMSNVSTRDKRKQKMTAQKKQAKDKRMLLRRGIK